MRSSLQMRLAIAVGIALAVGIGCCGYVLMKFHSYEDSAVQVMSGDQKNVLLSQLVEARVKAAQELVEISVGSQQADEAFKDKIQSIGDDVKALAKEKSSPGLDEAKRIVASLLASRLEVRSETAGSTSEDLFMQYRNLKTTAFNLYRMAWNSHWMTVAKAMGTVISELDNMPYHSGGKAANSVYPRITQLTSIISTSALSQAQKLALFGQLTALKNEVARYIGGLDRASEIKTQRLDHLQKLAVVLKKNGDSQSKNLTQFGNVAHVEFLKGLMSFLVLVLFAVTWYLVTAKRFATHIAGVLGGLARQLSGWLTPGGSVVAQGFVAPEHPDAELAEVYQVLDQVIRRVNSLRKEDILVKRLLNVPFMLVNRTKQAIFCNSALSILAKVRAPEEMGPVNYGNIVHLTDAAGKALDPVDRCFSETKEVSQVGLLRVGNDGIAVHAVCTPVLGPDHQAEYVMVHLRDLREENRRSEAELDRQLETVRTALEKIRNDEIPGDAPVWVRRPVTECISALKAYALDRQEKNAVVAGQVETMRERMAREAQLKKTVHKRTEQVKSEVAGLGNQLGELRAFVERVLARIESVESRGKALNAEYESVIRTGAMLFADLKETQSVLGSCMEKLTRASEITKSVRGREHVIRSLIDKSSVLNASNSVLGSKLGSRRELTPDDVIAITDNISQLISQFQRGYKFIEGAVDEMEAGFHEIAGQLEEELKTCIKLATEDQNMMGSLHGAEKIVAANREDMGILAKELVAVRGATSRVAMHFQAVENKTLRLVQIGQASLALQEQLELGFRDMFGQLDGPTAVAREGQA